MNMHVWKTALLDAVRNGGGDFNPDHPPCPRCGNEMDFHARDARGEFSSGDGYWECPDCDFRFYEDQLY